MRQLRIEGREPESPFERAVMARQPRIDRAMAIVLRCWKELGSERPVEQYPKIGKTSVVYLPIRGEIPYRAITTWARDEGLDYDGRRLLVTVIQRLDADRTERVMSELRRGS